MSIVPDGRAPTRTSPLAERTVALPALSMFVRPLAVETVALPTAPISIRPLWPTTSQAPAHRPMSTRALAVRTSIDSACSMLTSPLLLEA
jgi:hypothetical protein